jgi:hypothetical protein
MSEPLTVAAGDALVIKYSDVRSLLVDHTVELS